MVLREPNVDKALSLIRSKILENIGQVQTQAECQLGILQSATKNIDFYTYIFTLWKLMLLQVQNL